MTDPADQLTTCPRTPARGHAYVPLGTGPAAEHDGAGVEGEEHRTLLCAGLDRRRAGSSPSGS